MKKKRLLEIYRRHALNFLFLFFLISFSSCQINPASGEKEISLMSKREEISIGKQENEKIIKQFGGIYQNKKLQNYVNSLGQFLTNTSELPNLKFTFTILDSSIVNAFALPGGYIYLTRGLIALCQNEAQLAGVIAHEIGHVTARHTARRYTQAIGTNLIVNVLGSLIKNQALMNLLGNSAGLYSLSYSRKHEYEADQLALRYMRRAGFKISEMGEFLRVMENYSKLQQKKVGSNEKRRSELLSTHPTSFKRVQKLIEKSQEIYNPNPIVGTEIFLRKIDGITFGDNINSGIIANQKFSHAKLKFSFNLNESFYFINLPNLIIGNGPNSSKILFDIDNSNNFSNFKNYIKKWSKENSIIEVQEEYINGLKSANTTINKRNEKISFFAIRSGKLIYRFVLLAKHSDFFELNKDFLKVVSSFHLLSEEEIKKIKPNKVKIFSYDNLEEIKKFISLQSIQKKYSKDTFEILNDISSKSIKDKSKIKLIIN